MQSARWRKIWTLLVLTMVIIFAGIVVWNRFQGAAPVPLESTAPEQLASVNGVAITRKMVDRELKASRFNVASPFPPLTGNDLEIAGEEALNQLISRQLILQAAGRQGFRLEPETVQNRVDLLFGAYSDAVLDDALAQANTTREDLRWWVGQIFTVEEFTIEVILKDVPPEKRQEVYNEWLNTLRSQAKIIFAQSGQLQPAQALTGKPAPNFTLTTPDGQAVSLSDYRGQLVLLNFWATWCPSCVTEMPDYEQLYRRHQPDFVVLGINFREDPAHVQRYADGLDLSFPVLLDENGQVTNRQYRVSGMPGSFIVDKKGVIFYRHTGPMSAETLLNKLAELGLTGS